MSDPLVSIIIPTYKRSDMLDRAINSCFTQTYKNIEVIVVDDNNPETEYRSLTEKFMKKYSKEKNVRYIKRKTNGGGSAARNTGIKESKGEYITFLDDDDEYKKDKIIKQLDYIISNDYDMIFSDIMMFYDDIGRSEKQAYKKDFTLDKKGLLTKHLVDVISGTPTFMYKKKVLEEIDGFDIIPANQEYVLMLKTIVGGYRIGYLEHAGTIAHVHSNDVRISNNKKIIDAKIKVIELIKPYLKLIKKSDQRKTLFRLYSFVFYQSLKRKDIRFIKYGIILIKYIDLLVKKTINRKNKAKGEVIYK